MSAKVVALCIAEKAGDPLKSVREVRALKDCGLEGDRYCSGRGSFNAGKIGSRQVTLINAKFLRGTAYTCADSRRNIAIEGTELMWLIGREFDIGEARMRGVKYCDPCQRPTKLGGKKEDFKDTFHDHGGLIVEVIQSGTICIGDKVTPPSKGY